jgi:uncharacterized coiled-coil protein SlyX
MATTFADLEARVRGLESRALRAEEDITAIIGTVMETRDDVKSLRDDVKWLKRAAQALLDHGGIEVDHRGTGDEA